MRGMIWAVLGVTGLAATPLAAAPRKAAPKASAAKTEPGYQCTGGPPLGGASFRTGPGEVYTDGKGATGKYELRGDWGTFIGGPFDGYFTIRQPDGRLGINNDGSKNYVATCRKKA